MTVMGNHVTAMFVIMVLHNQVSLVIDFSAH